MPFVAFVRGIGKEIVVELGVEGVDVQIVDDFIADKACLSVTLNRFSHFLTDVAQSIVLWNVTLGRFVFPLYSFVLFFGKIEVVFECL